MQANVDLLSRGDNALSGLRVAAGLRMLVPQALATRLYAVAAYLAASTLDAGIGRGDPPRSWRACMLAPSGIAALARRLQGGGGRRLKCVVHAAHGGMPKLLQSWSSLFWKTDGRSAW